MFNSYLYGKSRFNHSDPAIFPAVLAIDVEERVAILSINERDCDLSVAERAVSLGVEEPWQP